MRRHSLAKASGAFIVLASMTSIASTGRGGERFWFPCRICDEKVCVTTAKPTQQTKDGWDVECTEVCIPAVRFPWEARPTIGCDGMDGRLLSKCGKVRSIRKLKKVDSERDTCEYEHTIIRRCSHRDDPCGGNSCTDCLPDETTARK